MNRCIAALFARFACLPCDRPSPRRVIFFWLRASYAPSPVPKPKLIARHFYA